MYSKSSFRLFTIIGVIKAIIVSKYVQDSMLNKIGVVSAIGVSKGNSGYIISLQLFNPATSQKDGSNEISAYTFSQHGRTIPEAIETINKQLSRRIFLDNAQVIIISESLVKSEGLSLLLNYLLRDPSLSSNIKIVLSKDVTPNEFLQIFTPLQKISGSRLNEMLNNNQSILGLLSNITPEKAKGKLLRGTNELAIPYITVKGDVTKGFSRKNIDTFTPAAAFTSYTSQEEC
ncbi:hypothetical protein ACR3AM_005730 [Bacillus thuringiensis]